MNRRHFVSASLVGLGTIALASPAAASTGQAVVTVESIVLPAGMSGTLHAAVIGADGTPSSSGAVLFSVPIPGNLQAAVNHPEPIANGIATHAVDGRLAVPGTTYPVTATYAPGVVGTGTITIPASPPVLTVPPVQITKGTTSVTLTATVTMPPGVPAPIADQGTMIFTIASQGVPIVIGEVPTGGLTRSITLALPPKLALGTYLVIAVYNVGITQITYGMGSVTVAPPAT